MVGSHGKDLWWIPAIESDPYLDVADYGEACHFPNSERIDLRSETGLRVWVRYSDLKTQLRFQFHHACCDGTGAYRVIEDVLVAYHAACNGESVDFSLRPIDPSSIARRDRIELGQFSIWKRAWRNCLVHPLRVARCVILRPDPILHPSVDRAADTCSSRLLDLPTHRLNKSQSKLLRQVAFAANATTNELLLRDLLLTLDQWNESHGTHSRNGMLRILVPMSLRTKREDEMPAANYMSLVSVTGREASLERPQQLLAEIVAEMSFIRRWRVDGFLHEEGKVVRSLPAIAEVLRRMAGVCVLSSALTNMGKIFARAPLPRKHGKIQSGRLLLETVSGAPPVSSFPATFGCHWYAGELILAMNYDRHRLAKNDANRLLSSYVQQLEATAQSAT